MLRGGGGYLSEGVVRAGWHGLKRFWVLLCVRVVGHSALSRGTWKPGLNRKLWLSLHIRIIRRECVIESLSGRLLRLQITSLLWKESSGL